MCICGHLSRFHDNGTGMCGGYDNNGDCLCLIFEVDYDR